MARISRILPKMLLIFFLSQLHIRIEQASGLLVWKWHIFKKLLEVKFWHTTLFIEAAFHLHNFCIDEHDYSVIDIGSCDPDTFRPNYTEYLDPLGVGDIHFKSRCHAVHGALLQKIGQMVESDHVTILFRTQQMLMKLRYNLLQYILVTILK